MKKRLAALVCALLAGAGAAARDEPSAAAPNLGAGVESCVDTATLRLADGGGRYALLDAADTESLRQSILLRYPAVAQFGAVPEHIVVWKKPDLGWIYVGLIADPGKPSDVCFTATFTAARFATTPALLVKYFGSAD